MKTHQIQKQLFPRKTVKGKDPERGKGNEREQRTSTRTVFSQFCMRHPHIGHPVPPSELEEVAGEKEVWLLCCPNVPAPNNQQKMDGWICNEGSRGHFKARFIWAYFTCPSQVSLLGQRKSSPGACLPSSSSPHLSLLSRPGVNSLQSSGSGAYLNAMPFPPEYLAPPAERMKKERKTKTAKNKKETTGKVVTSMAANYPSGPAAPPTASGHFSWVPRQMFSGDAAEEEGESDGDSDRGDEDRGEGDEAELVIDIPNE
uniref:Uncharacterized protein n=1 Tax=Astatotilapia calliptera TaxID=8154 RepID=A0AAX7UUD3_ASTCA